MLVDCTKCPRRSTGCDGCLVAALLEPPPEVELLDRDELWAIETLARAGFEVTLLEPPSVSTGRAPVAEQGPPPLRLVRRGGSAA
ncbi:hypothetical protein GCM10009557_96750 [Virgisporangium ochraceum]|uniref:Uncharacterized protein n=1 Tax=Virgisporangium ochraceum TaxID=65505 RepID=A0A8J3ZR69_9ACTN|nr:hypothetical protein [Virgisporangium ochraceum]GIJ68702.1 hypothetical protein Voc01_036190 [Virgisporangium ochraceum]